MITNFLAAIESEMDINSLPGTIIFVVMLSIFVGITVLVISLMIRLVRYLGTGGKERKLLRIELGKLAEEVHKMREQRDSGKTESAQSLSSSKAKRSEENLQ